MADKIYPKGLIGFAPHANAPDWALGDLTISLPDFWEWVKYNPEMITEYKGKKQLKLQITKSKDGRLSASVNTWKPNNESSSHGTTTRDGITTEDSSNLPF